MDGRRQCLGKVARFCDCTEDDWNRMTEDEKGRTLLNKIEHNIHLLEGFGLGDSKDTRSTRNQLLPHFRMQNSSDLRAPSRNDELHEQQITYPEQLGCKQVVLSTAPGTICSGKCQSAMDLDFTCLECQKHFSTERGLKIHFTHQHTPAGTLKCEWCSHQFKSRDSLAHHIRKYHQQSSGNNSVSCTAGGSATDSVRAKRFKVASGRGVPEYRDSKPSESDMFLCDRCGCCCHSDQCNVCRSPTHQLRPIVPVQLSLCEICGRQYWGEKCLDCHKSVSGLSPLHSEEKQLCESCGLVADLRLHNCSEPAVNLNEKCAEYEKKTVETDRVAHPVPKKFKLQSESEKVAGSKRKRSQKRATKVPLSDRKLNESQEGNRTGRKLPCLHCGGESFFYSSKKTLNMHIRKKHTEQ